MDMSHIIETLRNKRFLLECDICQAHLNQAHLNDDTKKLFVALGVAIDVLEIYQAGRIAGYLTYLNSYAVVEFKKDDYGRELLQIHLPLDIKTSNWYHAVELKQDLPGCFRSVAPDKLIEQRELDFDYLVREEEPLPFSQGDD